MTLELLQRSQRIRRRIVDACASPAGGHLGGSLSCTDILTVLYFAILRVDPARPHDPDRDIFLLSKGHAAIALYAALEERGFLPDGTLSRYGWPGSHLAGHPVRSVAGVEMPTGSLGHGLALALGFALSARLAGRSTRAFVVVGDGELQEGSCWEAMQCAAAQRADNLVSIVDRNGLQQAGRIDEVSPLEPLADRIRAFGWEVREVDGHDHSALRDALSTVPWTPGRPSALIARTVKGMGVPMVAGRVSSHYVTLNERNHVRAVRQLDGVP